MDDAAPESPQPESALSYKFQRLRERLRESIASGELAGKLPGERALAKKFHVNAKTLSKALTDLAAEGLLDRSIGRGTFVKGAEPAGTMAKRWLVVCDPHQADCNLVHLLRAAHPELDVLSDLSSVRPSFLNQFSAVIILSSVTPDTFVRDLVVRNISVVVVGHEPRTYSTHAVVFDTRLAVSMIARELIIGGHRRLAAVEPAQVTVVPDTLRQSAARYASDACIQACFPQDVSALAADGVTAFICKNSKLAALVREQLTKREIAIPKQVSVVAVGTASDHEPVSGYYMHREEKANAILNLLQQNSGRPATIWLAGEFVDHGTMAPVLINASVDALLNNHGAAI